MFPTMYARYIIVDMNNTKCTFVHTDKIQKKAYSSKLFTHPGFTSDTRTRTET